MIPKIIHYCWFGEGEIPEESKIYIEEWKEKHPDWKFMLWKEQNAPMDLSYMQKALQEKKYANMSNLLRLHVLIEYGGVYLDTDIQLIKPLDFLCTNSCFLGFEEGEENSEQFWVNNAIFGAEKNHPFIKELYTYLLETFDGSEQANLSSPRMTTELLKKNRGLTKYGYQKLVDVTLYPKEFFYPIHYSEVYKLTNLKQYIFPETIAVHIWARTWLDKETLLYIIDDLYRINHKQNPEKTDALSTQDEIIHRLKQIDSKHYFSRILVESLSQSVEEFRLTLKDQHQYILQLSNKNHSLYVDNDLLLKQVNDLQLSTTSLETELDSQQRNAHAHEINYKAAIVKVELLEAELVNRQKEIDQQFRQIETIKKEVEKDRENLRQFHTQRQNDAATIDLLQQKEKETLKQISTLILTVENQRLERAHFDERTASLHVENTQLQEKIKKFELDTEQHILEKELWQSEKGSLRKELEATKVEIGVLNQQIGIKNASYKQDIVEANNEQKSLRKAITWYQDTYEKRTIAAIVKDRIVQKLKNIKLFTNRLNGYHKIKRSKLKSGFQKNILCTIANYNETENALKLRKNISRYFDTVVFDSGSEKTSKKFISLGNVYYSGLLNNAYRCAKDLGYDYLFFICSDVEFQPEEIKKMVCTIKNIQLDEIGVYSPSSKGRSHLFCKQKFEEGLRSVPFTEGFIFVVDIKVLDEFLPVDLHKNLYGWGLDLAKGYFSRKLDKLCVIDDGVSVYHPESTGYSNQKAEDDMWHWENTFSEPGFKFFFESHIDILRQGNADKLKVSVIIPCYNQGQFLRQTIHNVLLQEYAHIEILIINDGSTDDTDLIAKSLICQYPQIKYFSKKNGGLGNTRNYGIQESSGELIQFLDADDLLSKDKFLAQAYSMLNKPTIEVSYTPYLCFEDGNDNNTWTYSRVTLEIDPLADLIQNWEKDLSIPVHCFLFRKEILNSVRFDEELPNHEDWLFHIYVAASRPSYHFENKGLAYYRVRTNSMARDRALMIKGKEMCINKAIQSGLFSQEYLQQLENRLEFPTINA